MKMASIRFFSLSVSAACLAAFAADPLGAQTPAPPVPEAVVNTPQKAILVAEVIRKTSGRQVESSGLGSKPYSLNKGTSGVVVSQTLSEVIFRHGGMNLRVPKTDVVITERDPNASRPPPLPGGYPGIPQDPRIVESERAAAAEAAALAAFKPGGLLKIISAKYSLSGNAPRNVKNKIEKMVPTGPLTNPVRIVVNDQLHRATANEPEVMIYSNSTSTRVVELEKNVLTISYQYNGQTLTRQAVEGTTMILP